MLFRVKQTYRLRTTASYRNKPQKSNAGQWLKILVPVCIIVIVAAGLAYGQLTTALPRMFSRHTAQQPSETLTAHPTPITVATMPTAQPSRLQPQPQATALPPPPPPKTACSNSTVSKLVLVSLSQQHMWACSSTQVSYETAVTTGAYTIEGDATPTGTWHIYNKQTNIYLTGPGYKDFVKYWIAFYTDYGFHDSSWQTFPFGDARYATEGSHGCVHLPDAAATWLYNWAPIGTTVTIEA